MRRLLLLTGAIVFVDTMFFAALTPLLADYADEFDLSKVGAGVLSAAYPAGALLGGLPAGMAAVRFGPRTTAIAGLLLMSGTTVAFGLAETVWLLDAARFVQGLASAAAWTAAFTWLIGAAPGGRRGQLIGTALGAAIVGALFGPVLGGFASVVGTEVGFGLVGALALGLAAWALATEPPPRTEAQPLAELGRALRDRRVAAAIWLVMLPALLFGTLSVLAPLRLDQLGFGALAISTTFLVTAGCEAAMNPFLGRLSDRRGRFLPLAAALAASAAVAALLPWPAHRLVLAGLVVLAGISFGGFWTPAMSLLTDAAEARGLEYAFAFALVNIAWAPGQALGAAGGAAVASATADAVPYLILAGACALTLAGLWRSASSSWRTAARSPSASSAPAGSAASPP